MRYKTCLDPFLPSDFKRLRHTVFDNGRKNDTRDSVEIKPILMIGLPKEYIDLYSYNLNWYLNTNLLDKLSAGKKPLRWIDAESH